MQVFLILDWFSPLFSTELPLICPLFCPKMPSILPPISPTRPHMEMWTVCRRVLNNLVVNEVRHSNIFFSLWCVVWSIKCVVCSVQSKVCSVQYTVQYTALNDWLCRWRTEPSSPVGPTRARWRRGGTRSWWRRTRSWWRRYPRLVREAHFWISLEIKYLASFIYIWPSGAGRRPLLAYPTLELVFDNKIIREWWKMVDPK